MTPKEAVIAYQFGEKLKSELIIASMLIERTSTLNDERLEGGKDVLLIFLRALRGEVNIACNVVESQYFPLILDNIDAMIDGVESNNFRDVPGEVSKALSRASTEAGRAAQLLIENDLY